MKNNNKKYSIMSNYKYSYKNLIECSGTDYFKYAVVNVISGVAFPFLAIYLPSLAISLLTGNMEIEKVFLILIGYMLVLYFSKYILVKYEEKTAKELFMFRIAFIRVIINHILDMEYDKLESSVGQKKMKSAAKAVFKGNDIGVEAFLGQVTVLIINVLGLIIYSVTAARMNIWIFVFILISTIVVSALNARAGNWESKNIDRRQKYYNRFRYLCDQSIAPKNGKDIRLYNLKGWFVNSFSDVRKDFSEYERESRKKYFTASAADKIMTLLRDLFVYGYLIYQMINGNMEIDKFVLFVGIAAGFGTWMNGIFDGIRKANENSIIMDEFRDFMEFGYINEDEKEKELLSVKPHEIRLENVCFKYSGAENEVLKDINLTINSGEKLALVGMNGAGKTTLVKLISGLYTPTSGKIYIDGIDTEKMSKKDYWKQFAVVFQDVSAFAFSIASNITCGRDEDIDKERVNECLVKAGLFDKVESLDKKTDTSLLKLLDENGVELSGGEMQKLMLARALYKKSGILILDEPTAALDPIAESEMYEKYSSFAKDKTSIFISHRLSSTRFCDRIIMLDGGKIVEEGTHESLISKNGEYAHMFEVQSHYYKEKEVACSEV